MSRFKISTNALYVIEAESKEQAFENFLKQLDIWECDIVELAIERKI